MVKTELVDAHGDHLRWLPGPMAKAMVSAGHAEIHNSNGKVKSIRLVAAAATHATRIGEPSPPNIWGAHFTRLERIDGSASRVYQHHPRCTYE
jgi:hypothetical protein